jgi:outer membrane beta-barrel protein
MNIRIPVILIVLVLIFSVKTFAGEKDLYDFLWLDPDKSVFVLQNKVHPKVNSIYLDIGYVTSTSSTFQDTTGGQLQFGYFFTEQFAIEANYITYSNVNNSAHDGVQIVAGLAPFVRRPISSASLFLIYSPFYGKINTFNRIFYFDWAFGIGSGQYKMESNIDTAESKTENTFKTENYTPIQLKTNFKVHINKSLHIGVEYLNTNFQAGTPKDKGASKWTQSNDLIISVGVSF